MLLLVCIMLILSGIQISQFIGYNELRINYNFRNGITTYYNPSDKGDTVFFYYDDSIINKSTPLWEDSLGNLHKDEFYNEDAFTLLYEKIIIKTEISYYNQDKNITFVDTFITSLNKYYHIRRIKLRKNKEHSLSIYFLDTSYDEYEQWIRIEHIMINDYSFFNYELDIEKSIDGEVESYFNPIQKEYLDVWTGKWWKFW